MEPTDLSHMQARLRSVMELHGLVHFDRGQVVESAESTQDSAQVLAGQKAGLVLAASRQTKGRARLGRNWVSGGDHGLAATFVVSSREFEASRLSLAAGVAACRTVEKALELQPDESGMEKMGSALLTSALSGGTAMVSVDARPTQLRIGLRWPNDVVLVRSDGVSTVKIAGILIEVVGQLAYVGVGINVLQSMADFPQELAGRAASLKQLGSLWTRGDALYHLTLELDHALSQAPVTLAERWKSRDILRGSRQTFTWNGKSFQGIIQDIDPTNSIHLRTDEGGMVQLPALTTSLVHA